MVAAGRLHAEQQSAIVRLRQIDRRRHSIRGARAEGDLGRGRAGEGCGPGHDSDGRDLGTGRRDLRERATGQAARPAGAGPARAIISGAAIRCRGRPGTAAGPRIALGASAPEQSQESRENCEELGSRWTMQRRITLSPRRCRAREREEGSGMPEDPYPSGWVSPKSVQPC